MYYAVYQVYYVYPPGKANTHAHPQFSGFYLMKPLKTKEIQAIRSSFRVLIGFIAPK